MRKVGLFLLLTYVAAVPCANCLILSLPWSVTNKALCLTWFWLGCLSAALLVIQESLGTWSTTRKLGGWNRLATLAKKERAIQERIGPKETKSFKHRDIADYKNFLEDM